MTGLDFWHSANITSLQYEILETGLFLIEMQSISIPNTSYSNISSLSILAKKLEVLKQVITSQLHVVTRDVKMLTLIFYPEWLYLIQLSSLEAELNSREY